ncbi:MAG: 16S rRNA (guanine(527)-N(7))-methyltransferase RsmG [Bacteroidales bacterium]|nr:16S rRNA (guanine(527)-N(7))-methyltransferase RsmG [Bacteroidales bacterium]
MDTAELIIKEFPELSVKQIEQFQALGALYGDWNSKINVISRKDIDNLYANHVLHSLAIAKFLGPLALGTTMLDVGTGGGFPGVPLAIYYPECRFHMIDRIGKKIRVAQDVAYQIGLDNVTFQHGDVGECRERYDYVVSRAVMPLNALVKLVKKNIASKGKPGNLYSPGLVCLKGGDLAEESQGIGSSVIEAPLGELLHTHQYEDKCVVYVPL